MDFNALISSLAQTVGTRLPTVMSALAILVIGWIVAVLVRGTAKRAMQWLQLDERARSAAGVMVPMEGFIAGLLFWLVLLITLVGVFNALNLQQVSSTLGALVSQIMNYLPKLLAGCVVGAIAWVVAIFVKTLAEKTLAATDIDDRLTDATGMQPMSRTASSVLFWLVILMFLPMVLSAFELSGLLDPLTHMVDRMLGTLPNIFAALIIGFVGYVVARILRGLVVSLLRATRAEELAQKAGVRDGVQLSQLVGTLVFMFVFVPSLIAALDALQIDAISRPATDMLSKLLAAVPNIVAALLIITISFYVGRFACGLVASLLASMGFDTVPAKLGVEQQLNNLQPSRLAGQTVQAVVMLLATAEAADQLGLEQVRELVAMFIKFGGDVLVGGAILAIGWWIANLLHAAIARASGSANMASLARIAVIGLVIAMGLRAMGIADDIVNLAFGLTLGAIAVAVALAFGLGGREAAGKQMEYWLSKWRKPD